MSIEEIPADEVATMTAFWHRAFNRAGCNPMCHCCERMIKSGEKFKLSTVFEAPGADACLHYYKDLSELQIKALKGQSIEMDDLKKLKDDFFFEEHFKRKGGLKGISDLVQPASKDVMLCATCTPEEFKLREIKALKGQIKARDKSRHGGCFRINGKIIH